MKTPSFYAVMPILVLAMAACDSSTGLKGCDLPAQNASLISTAPFMTGVVTLLSYEPGGNSPGGPIGPEILVHLSVGGASGATYPMQRLFLFAGTAVFSARGGTTKAMSACRLSVGDRVSVWVPEEQVGSGFGDVVGIDSTTFTWEASQVTIVPRN
jgi:hypothetical protein